MTNSLNDADEDSANCPHAEVRKLGRKGRIAHCDGLCLGAPTLVKLEKKEGSFFRKLFIAAEICLLAPEVDAACP